MSTRKTMTFTQIEVAPFSTERGKQSYSVLALGKDGNVYRYDPKCEGWIKWPNKIAGCRDEHRGRR